MPEKASAWADLSTRILSAVVMLAVAVLALMTGPLGWSLFVLAVSFVMFWELAALCEPGIAPVRRFSLTFAPVLLPGALTVALAGGFAVPPPSPADAETGGMLLRALAGLGAGLALVILAGAVNLRSGRLIWAGYAPMALIGALYLVFALQEFGVIGVAILVAIVAISDILGYFAGRLIGGPKFWPRVSPKKTWSGTVAGWIGAGLFGALMFQAQGAALLGAGAAIGLAFAGQMGDIAESAIKRRAGVKDSSRLIPGHGGFLDRLDALVAAAALAGILTFSYLAWSA
ncbi:phosphatidate cytidylyltransferase [Maritimibacter sp. HL-12]|jgi:phosphatidate cytidylyltransferase|uniref:phosphatidate cytidylyltransferase n=1 Tax=Maritimibacter sp. HL-12 TaxID=1162418 RepID=UPI000A0EF788|nr:phosphatidate cytidylyltransferase [Maritimibacter sp. HL-12]SMH57766.1 phosphatidate cytidylyltransferase [Maritimibacter sp. HL-12]